MKSLYKTSRNNVKFEIDVKSQKDLVYSFSKNDSYVIFTYDLLCCSLSEDISTLNEISENDMIYLLAKFIKSNCLVYLDSYVFDFDEQLIKILNSYPKSKKDLYSFYNLSEIVCCVSELIHHVYLTSRNLDLNKIFSWKSAFSTSELRHTVGPKFLYVEDSKTYVINYKKRTSDYEITSKFLYSYAITCLGLKTRLPELKKCLNYIIKSSIKSLKSNSSVDDITLIAFYESLKFLTFELSFLESRCMIKEAHSFLKGGVRNGGEIFFN